MLTQLWQLGPFRSQSTIKLCGNLKPEGTPLFGLGESYLSFVNGRCHFERSMPPLVTKPLVMMDVIYSLD